MKKITLQGEKEKKKRKKSKVENSHFFLSFFKVFPLVPTPHPLRSAQAEQSCSTLGAGPKMAETEPASPGSMCVAEVLHFALNCLLSVSSTHQHLHLSPGRGVCLQPRALAVEQEPPKHPLCCSVPQSGSACEGSGSAMGPSSLTPLAPCPPGLLWPHHAQHQGTPPKRGYRRAQCPTQQGRPVRPLSPSTWLSPLPPRCAGSP